MQFPNLISRLQRRRLKPPQLRPGSRAKLLVVVEGRHDVVFLRTLSRILHAADPAIPDLGSLEQTGELVFLPFGGGDVLAWADRLAAIGLPELHIYDRETAPETELRHGQDFRVDSLPGRAQKRFRERTKKWLNWLGVDGTFGTG